MIPGAVLRLQPFGPRRDRDGNEPAHHGQPGAQQPRPRRRAPLPVSLPRVQAGPVRSGARRHRRRHGRPRGAALRHTQRRSGRVRAGRRLRRVVAGAVAGNVCEHGLVQTARSPRTAGERARVLWQFVVVVAVVLVMLVCCASVRVRVCMCMSVCVCLCGVDLASVFARWARARLPDQRIWNLICINFGDSLLWSDLQLPHVSARLVQLGPAG